MRLALALSIGSIILMAQVPAEAAHCTTYSTTTTDIEARTIVIEFDDLLNDGLYFYYDACQPDCLGFSFGFYDEVNGIPGLQREDELVDDTCHGLVRADGRY